MRSWIYIYICSTPRSTSHKDPQSKPNQKPSSFHLQYINFHLFSISNNQGHSKNPKIKLYILLYLTVVSAIFRSKPIQYQRIPALLATLMRNDSTWCRDQLWSPCPSIEWRDAEVPAQVPKYKQKCRYWLFCMWHVISVSTTTIYIYMEKNIYIYIHQYHQYCGSNPSVFHRVFLSHCIQFYTKVSVWTSCTTKKIHVCACKCTNIQIHTHLQYIHTDINIIAILLRPVVEFRANNPSILS